MALLTIWYPLKKLFTSFMNQQKLVSALRSDHNLPMLDIKHKNEEQYKNQQSNINTCTNDIWP